MVCAACHRDNPANVQFCLSCGTRVEPVLPPVATSAPAPMPVFVVERPSSTSGAASRPFGLVFAAVVTCLTALSWLLASGFLLSLAMMESAVGSVPDANSIINLAQNASGSLLLSPTFVSIASPLLTLAGFIGVTGAIGLWLLTDWGRRVTTWLQAFGILVGVLIASQAGARMFQIVGLGGFCVFAGLIVIAYSVAIMVYLMRSETSIWFQQR